MDEGYYYYQVVLLYSTTTSWTRTTWSLESNTSCRKHLLEEAPSSGNKCLCLATKDLKSFPAETLQQRIEDALAVSQEMINNLR